MKNKDKIILKDWRFWGTHGVYTEEKQHNQEFKLDITLYLSLDAAAKSDDLNQTIDYTALYPRVKAIIEGESYNLLEALAGKIIQLLLAYPQVEGAKVALTKCSTKIDGFTFAPCIELKRYKDTPA